MPLVVLHPDVLVDAFEGGVQASNLLTLLAFGALRQAMDEADAEQRFLRGNPDWRPGGPSRLAGHRAAQAAWTTLRSHAPRMSDQWILAASDSILTTMREHLGEAAAWTSRDEYAAYLCVYDYLGRFVEAEALDDLRDEFSDPDADDVALTAAATGADFLLLRSRAFPQHAPRVPRLLRRKPRQEPPPRQIEWAGHITEVLTVGELMARPNAPAVADVGGSLRLLHQALPPLLPIHA